MRAITGRIDLCHANDSRDPPGTGADRHANLGAGQMDPDDIRRMIRACAAAVIVETPGAGHPADLEFVRAALAG
jgi:deoxyribonuclease-4